MAGSSLGSLPLFEQASLHSANTSDPGDRPFVDLVRDFREFGRPSVAVQDGGIDYLINEFWTAGQRQAHSIHEVSYRACFKPQLPEFFIERLTKRTDAVYDPFMGRGTTPVQAGLMGRRPVGNDINPLSEMLVRPRLEPVPLHALEERLRSIADDEMAADGKSRGGRCRTAPSTSLRDPRALPHRSPV